MSCDETSKSKHAQSIPGLKVALFKGVRENLEVSEGYHGKMFISFCLGDASGLLLHVSQQLNIQ